MALASATTTASASASASEGSSCEASASSSAAAESYIGSLISLTSKAEIRYEGILVSINPGDSTIALQNVKSYGTEGRKKIGPQVPPSDKFYEYILFRGSDIKDLQVKSSPVYAKPQVNGDPAIIQTHHAYASSAISSPSLGGGALSGQSSYTVQSSLARPSFPDAFSLYQSDAHKASWASSSASTSTNVTSTSAPMYWQGYFGSSGSQDYAQQQFFPLRPPSVMLQNQMRLAESHPPTSTSNFTELPATSTLSSAGSASQFGISNLADVLPSLPCDASEPSSSLPSHLSTMSSFSSFNQLNASRYSVSGKAGPSLIPVLPVPTSTNSSPSVLESTSALSNTFPSLLTPDPTAPLVNPKLCPEQEDMAAILPLSSNTPSSICQLPQEPLLPLPLLSQQGQTGVNQFSEEFDFTAMNEKFKKDEVWGSLGKAKQKSTPDGTEDNTAHESPVVEDDYKQDTKFGRNPVYNKHDFFDNLSCNSLNRGAWSGRTKFSERMKLDTETFGDFQQRTPFGRGSHGTSDAGNFRVSYNRGRGYGYSGGRGRGGHRPF